MNESYIKNVVEAALLAAGRPLQIAELAQLFEESGSPGTVAIREALASLETDYTGRGIEVKETGNGFRIQVRRDLAGEISRLWPERPPRYSRALLETLALIAYRQPITRGEIEQIRGVAVNPNIIKTLHERNWIRVVGHRDVPGKPELLGTSREFLDYFNLKKLDDLPTLAQLKELEDLRVQLMLPGAEAEVLTGTETESEPQGPLDAAAELDSQADDEEEGSAQAAAEPRSHGLVASGAQDDSN